MSIVLEARELSAGYHGRAVVHAVNLEVKQGEVVGLLGPNGAGKTTTLLTMAGDLPAISGAVLADGVETKAPLHRRARHGLSLVTEERSVFMRLSVADNLKMAGCSADEVFELFPELRPLTRRLAGLLSGGEQQMLTLGRALTRAGTTVLLADELSLGLGPLVVKRLLRAVREAASQRGVGVLLVEQHVQQMLRIADRVAVMNHGSIVLSGTSAEVAQRLNDVEQSYLASTA
jgi:branched-chain amino acid transport system ATP-binding protein